MVIYLVRSFGSLNVCFRINERKCVANILRVQLKVSSSRLEGSEFLTSEFLRNFSESGRAITTTSLLSKFNGIFFALEQTL